MDSGSGSCSDNNTSSQEDSESVDEVTVVVEEKKPVKGRSWVYSYAEKVETRKVHGFTAVTSLIQANYVPTR